MRITSECDVRQPRDCSLLNQPTIVPVLLLSECTAKRPEALSLSASVFVAIGFAYQAGTTERWIHPPISPSFLPPALRVGRYPKCCRVIGPWPVISRLR